MLVIPNAFPLDFRQRVVGVALQSDDPSAQVTRDFGLSESCLHRWFRLAHGERHTGQAIAAADRAPALRGSKNESTDPLPHRVERNIVRSIPMYVDRWARNWPIHWVSSVQAPVSPPTQDITLRHAWTRC